MSCLSCGRSMPRGTSGWCSSCEHRLNHGEESILCPIGSLAELIERTSLGDFALLCIALNRKENDDASRA